MRISLLGLLLCSGLCLGQSPTGQMGTVGVNDVEVTTDSQVSSEHLQAVMREIESHSYPPSQTEEIVERARYTLQRDGYFKADVSLADMRSVNPAERMVVTLAIHEGQQFRLKKITFTGNKQIPESQLRQQFEIAHGETFDTEKIRKGLDQVRRMYFSRGYINFSPVVNAKAEEDSGTVTLQIDCDEGKQFHFASWRFTGGNFTPATPRR